MSFDNKRAKELNKIIYEILEIDWSQYFLVKINVFGIKKSEQLYTNFTNVKFIYCEKVIFNEISLLT